MKPEGFVSFYDEKVGDWVARNSLRLRCGYCLKVSRASKDEIDSFARTHASHAALEMVALEFQEAVVLDSGRKLRLFNPTKMGDDRS